MFHQLLHWSQKEFNQLPWRRKRSLYRTLVSEIMLQQTTVSTVLGHFERFLERFPDLQSLAEASEDELLVAWKGLGYYRRARSLKKIAETLAREYKGEFPKDVEALQEITGIGPYTANALVAIGMDRPALAVDANLERVLARIHGYDLPKGPALQKFVLAEFNAGRLVPERDLSFRALNEALMDLGRTICQANKAACELCLMKAHCVAFRSGTPLAYPRQGKEKKTIDHELELLRIVVQKKDSVLVYLKEDKEWLAGQWELPTFIISSTDQKLKQYPSWTHKVDKQKLVSFKTGITKYTIVNFLTEGHEDKIKKLLGKRKKEWRRLDDPHANFSTATMKALKKAGLVS